MNCGKFIQKMKTIAQDRESEIVLLKKELEEKDEHIDLCRKTNTNLAAKCWGYVQQLKAKEKELAMLHEHIQKQHVAQPIKMLVCEQCGKEL